MNTKSIFFIFLTCFYSMGSFSLNRYINYEQSFSQQTNTFMEGGQVFFKNKFHITPFAALGLTISEIDLTGYWLGYSFIAGKETEWNHRLSLSSFYGRYSDANDYQAMNNIILKLENIKYVSVEPAIIGGFKGASSIGLFLQIHFGLASFGKLVSSINNFSIGPTAGIGLGYKF